MQEVPLFCINGTGQNEDFIQKICLDCKHQADIIPFAEMWHFFLKPEEVGRSMEGF